MLSPWQQFGLIGLLSGSGTILLFIIIKWVLATTKEIMAQAAKEREALTKALADQTAQLSKEREAWIKALSDHTMQAKDFHNSVKDAHQFQRDEHKEMIAILRRINGYKN